MKTPFISPSAGRLFRLLVFFAAALVAVRLSVFALASARAQAAAEKGWKELRAGSVAAAIGSFQRAVKSRPGYPPAHKGLGEAYFLLFRKSQNRMLLAKAGEHFEQAVMGSAADLPSQARLFHISMLRGRADLAVPRAAALAAAFPPHNELQRNMVQMAVDLRALPEGAKAAADKSFRAAVRGALSRILASREMALDDIPKHFGPDYFSPAEMLAIAGGFEGGMGQLARMLMDGGRWEELGPIYASAAGGKSAFFPAAGKALFDRQKRIEAMDFLMRRLEEAPDEAGSNSALAEIAYDGKDESWPLAEAHHRRAVALEPDNPEWRRAYGIALFERQAYDRAEQELGRAVELKPDDAESWWRLGRADQGLGKFDAAKRHFRKAVILAPHNPAYREALRAPAL